MSKKVVSELTLQQAESKKVVIELTLRQAEFVLDLLQHPCALGNLSYEINEGDEQLCKERYAFSVKTGIKYWNNFIAKFEQAIQVSLSLSTLFVRLANIGKSRAEVMAVKKQKQLSRKDEK